MSVRSCLSTGLAGAVLAAGAGVAVVAPVAIAPLPVMASPAVQLSALVASLPKAAATTRPTKPGAPPLAAPAGTVGDWIINSYNAVQPWAQYSVDLGAWGVGFMPFPISLAAPQMTIGYSGIEPLAQASVYSFAYALSGQWSLIGPTVKTGVDTAYGNFVGGQIGWITSFFPPAPPLGAATVAAPKAAARAAAATPSAAEAAAAPGVKPAAIAAAVAAQAVSVSTPVEPAVSVEASAVAEAPVVRRAARAPRAVPAATAAVAAPTFDAPEVPAVADESSSRAMAPQAPASRGNKGTRAPKNAAGAASSAKASRSGR